MEFVGWVKQMGIGDLATWISAFAIVAAVWVALLTSNRALRSVEDLRKDDQRRAEQVTRSQATTLAIGLHHELYLAIGQLHFYAKNIHDALAAGDAGRCIVTIREAPPTIRLSFLRDVASRLDPLQPRARLHLIRCLTHWNALNEAPSSQHLDNATEQEILDVSGSILGTLNGMIFDFEAAFEEILPIVKEVLPGAMTLEQVTQPPAPSARPSVGF